MATEFEQLRLSITLIDDASAGFKSVREELRGTTGSAAEFQKLIRDNTKSSQVYGNVVGYVDGRLVLLGGAVGFLSSKLDGIGASLASQGPTIQAFAQQQRQANQLAQMLGMSIGHLKSIRSQAETQGISPEDADRIAAASMGLRARLSTVGGRTQFQQMLTRSGFRSDPNAFTDYTMYLSTSKDYAEMFNRVNQARKELEKYAIETEGRDPQLVKEMGIKWMIQHGLPAQSVLMEELRMPTNDYLATQQARADAAEKWLREVDKINKSINSIKGKLLISVLGPEGALHKALQEAVKYTKLLADNAERWFTFWFFIQNPNLLIPFYMPGAPGGKDDKAKPTWPPSLNPLEWHWNPFKWRWRMKLSGEIEELGDHVKKINLITSPTGPKIVPVAFEGGSGGGTGYSGTQGLPGWLQTPGGGGRLPPTPGTGTGPTPGTNTGPTPGTPSAPARPGAPQAPSGGTPGAAPRPAPTPGTGTGPTPGTSTGGTPGTPSAATPSPGTPQAGELPIIDYSAQANLRTGGDMGKVEGMVIHHTSGVYGGRGPAGVSDVLRNRGFSSTFFIDREGRIYRLTPEGKMAFHTKPGGTGTLGSAGAQFSNRNMEGVEIEARNDADVLPIQRAAAANLIGQRSRLHGYDPKTNVVGHGELNRDKERDEGMSTVSRIRSGELSTVIGAPMPAAEPRAPEEATPVAPHPLLGAQQAAPAQGGQGGFTPIPPGGLPKLSTPEVPTAPALPGGGPGGRENIPTTSRSPRLDTSNPAIREALRIPRLPGESDEAWIARGRKALERARSAPGIAPQLPAPPAVPEQPVLPNLGDGRFRSSARGPIKLSRPSEETADDAVLRRIREMKEESGLSARASPGSPAREIQSRFPKSEEQFDRSVIDKSLQNEVSAKVKGDANVSVDVSTPEKKTGDTPKDLFKKDVVERQSTMDDSERGPSVEVD